MTSIIVVVINCYCKSSSKTWHAFIL